MAAAAAKIDKDERQNWLAASYQLHKDRQIRVSAHSVLRSENFWVQQQAGREDLRWQVSTPEPRSSLPNAIERQLAHAEHLPEPRKMMQALADYLDGLKAGAEVIPLFRKA